MRLLAMAVLLAACSSSSAPAVNPAAALRDATIERLDAGTVDSLPTGSVYVRFIRFAQPPGYVINSKQHVPSIVYVQTGVHQLALAGTPPIDLAAGEAKFHQSVTHMHLNPGTAASVWFSIGVWPSSARGQPLVDPIARAAFESDDVDRSVLPQVAYSEVLRRVSIGKLGTAGAHRFGGLAAYYVLSGQLTIRSAHRAPLTLSADEGAAFLPGVALEETNPDASPAVFLEYIATPVGSDFDVPLAQPPAA